MSETTSNVSGWTRILGILSANWATIAILALLALSGVRLIYNQEKTIDILMNSNEVYASSYEEVTNRMKQLTIQMEENNARLDRHYIDISRNLSISEARISALEKAASKEGVVGAKPGLSTLKAKKAIKENEDAFSCLSGNTQYCSSSPAQ